MSSVTDTTIRLKKDTKRTLSKLDFVGKEHSYEDIVVELVNVYNNVKNNVKKVKG